VQDAVTSPCIDAGDMTSPIGFEPFPNGGVINIGAYGGTAEASKSYFGEPVCKTVVAGDINGDCKVDFKDFAFMAFHWLECIPGILNQPPVVNITNPEDGDTFVELETIIIEAEASDVDGSVVKVVFLASGFYGTSIIGEDDDGSDGWNTNWSGFWPGVYGLTAKAIDNDGAITTSAPVVIHNNGRERM
jgi:hypothetical protein